MARPLGIRIERKCKNCSKVFYIRPFQERDGTGIFCSDKCRRIYKREHKMSRKEIWTRYNRKKSTAIKKRLWHEYKVCDGKVSTISKDVKCSMCGTSVGYLLIHHINGNHNDNTTGNHKIVCRSCHARIHNLHRVGLLSRRVDLTDA